VIDGAAVIVGVDVGPGGEAVAVVVGAGVPVDAGEQAASNETRSATVDVRRTGRPPVAKRAIGSPAPLRRLPPPRCVALGENEGPVRARERPSPQRGSRATDLHAQDGLDRKPEEEIAAAAVLQPRAAVPGFSRKVIAGVEHLPE